MKKLKKKQKKTIKKVVIAVIVIALLFLLAMCRLPQEIGHGGGSGGSGGGGGDDDGIPPPTNGEDDDDPFEGDPVVYCESSWPPPTGQKVCDMRAGCPSEQECIYKPATLVTKAMCVCETPPAPILDCQDSCEEHSFAVGYCSYEITKYPCGSDYHNIAGSFLCDDGSDPLLPYGACCCT